MKIYEFTVSHPWRTRASLHSAPIALNNAIVDRLKSRSETIWTKTLEGVVGALENRRWKRVHGVLDTTSLKVGDLVRIEVDPASTAGRYTEVFLWVTSDSHGVRANIFFRNTRIPEILTTASHRYNKGNWEGVPIQHIPSLALPDEFLLPAKTRKAPVGKV